MISAWWLAPAIGLSIIFGFLLCAALGVIVAVMGKKRPMAEPRTWTGDVTEDADDYDQFLHDLNNRRDAS